MGQVGRLVDAFGRFDGAAVTIVCVCVSAGDDVIGGVNFIRCKCLVEIGLKGMIGLVELSVERVVDIWLLHLLLWPMSLVLVI